VIWELNNSKVAFQEIIILQYTSNKLESGECTTSILYLFHLILPNYIPTCANVCK